MSSRPSESFSRNRLVWTIFGLWPGKIPIKYYKCFSFVYLIATMVVYNVLLTLNLIYTPRKIDFLIKEVIFYFTEIAVASKAFMVLFKRKKLEALFALLDCEEFQGSDEIGKEIVQKHNNYYRTYLMTYTILCNFTYSLKAFFPVVGFIIFGIKLDLPVCQYYFLSDETRNEYFTSIYIYQAFALYIHMMYNVHIDTLISGLMVMAIGQLKVLCHDLENLKAEKSDTGDGQTDYVQGLKLRNIINHHKLFLQYCVDFEAVIGGTIFVQYGLGSAIMCIVMVAFQQNLTLVDFMSMLGYTTAMNLEIFLPAWLGAQISYESQEIVVSAYKSEWLLRSKRYTSSFRMLVERAKHPVVITALKIFPLSLATYITIMKTAYSCFAVLRNIQDRQVQAMH